MGTVPDYGDNVSTVGDLLRYPKRAIIQALKDGFSNPKLYLALSEKGEEIENPFLYKAGDKETAKDSKLEIADMWSEELNATAPRPIIIAQRGELSFQDGSIAAFREAGLPGFVWKGFMDLVRVPINLLCFSRIDTESEELALATAFFIRLFREVHRKKSQFYYLRSPVVGSTTPVKNDVRVELFSTPVSVETGVVLRWIVKDSKPPVAKAFVDVIKISE